MTEVIMDLAVFPGESLTYKVGQLIANIKVRKDLDRTHAQILRQMRTERDHSRPGFYKVTFGYEVIEEEELD